MKKKKLVQVYMREVEDSIILSKHDYEMNADITFKYIVSISDKIYNLINGRKVVVADNGYSFLEYSPINGNYNVRVFIDDKGNIIKYYFDVIKNFECIDNEIYYNDLYVDIIYDMKYANGCCNYISIVDEGELKMALDNGDINQLEYDLAYEVAFKLMNELANNKNIFVNRGNEDYLYFIDKIRTI